MPGPENFPPCAEWKNGPVDADVAGTVEEFARWLNYLLHPAEHGGPRRYVCVDCRHEFDADEKIEERFLHAALHHGPGRVTNHVSTEWELRSVLEGFDPSSAFYALHETSGIRWSGTTEESMERCFDKLRDSFFCLDTKRDAAKSPLYTEDESFKDFAGYLDSLLEGIGQGDPRYEEAKAYHENVKRYAKCHENQMFALAESLGRYRGGYLGARELILARMRKMVEIFQQKVAPEPAAISWRDVLEVGISLGIAAAFSVVPIASVAGRVAYGVITGAISEVIVGKIRQDEAKNTYEAKSPDGPTVENSWRELVDWFVVEADRISNELYISIEPNTEAYGGLSHVMLSQFIDIQYATGPGGTRSAELPELPAFVPRT